MSSSQIPATVRAVITDPDLGRPTIEEIPFGTRAAVKELGPDAVVVSTRALGLNPRVVPRSARIILSLAALMLISLLPFSELTTSTHTAIGRRTKRSSLAPIALASFCKLVTTSATSRLAIAWRAWSTAAAAKTTERLLKVRLLAVLVGYPKLTQPTSSSSCRHRCRQCFPTSSEYELPRGRRPNGEDSNLSI